MNACNKNRPDGFASVLLSGLIKIKKITDEMAIYKVYPRKNNLQSHSL
jgi:hypothetical protein